MPDFKLAPNSITITPFDFISSCSPLELKILQAALNTETIKGKMEEMAIPKEDLIRWIKPLTNHILGKFLTAPDYDNSNFGFPQESYDKWHEDEHADVLLKWLEKISSENGSSLDQEYVESFLLHR